MTSSSLISCPECVKSVEVKYIGEHLAFVHKYTIEERRIILGFLAKDRATLASVYPFKCDVCLESFQTKRELSSHQIGVHNPAEPSTENEFECAFAECEQSFATFEDFVIHCAINHSAGSHYRFEIINESFQDMRELLNVIASEMQCWIRKDGTVEVIACTEHLGHEKDPRKLLLSEKQKDELQGLNAPEIFKKVRKRYGVMSRMHFVTDADLALLFDSKYIHEQVFGTQKMNYTCSECDEGPMPIQQLRKHIGEIHGRVAKLANAANSSGKHGTKWNDIYYSCKECQFLCFSQSVLYTHVKVIENEEGVLDCIGFFGHLGHQSDCGVSADVVKKGTEAETNEDETTSRVEGDEVQPCCLCGDITVPELDGMMIMETQKFMQSSFWMTANVEHKVTDFIWHQFLFAGIGEAIPLTHAFDSSLITE
uniref:C2H2-type domain-containing protein n=1 Tax=Angiostrongylus cantonensis TaxID=6313 RepID=A0A0K0DIX4_ANGCA